MIKMCNAKKMNKDLEKIIKLSDHPWIKERWKLKIGDWFWNPNINKLRRVDHIHLDYGESYLREKSGFIWLPVDFNPITGNHQIDDLLIEATKLNSISNMRVLRDEFTHWLNGNNTVESTIILKLIWLRELIEKEVKNGNKRTI